MDCSWNEFGTKLHPALVQHLTLHFGLLTPTAVQKTAIPKICAGVSVAVESCTGSGKTLAFVLPMLQKIVASPSRAKQPQALVLAPTRELALQLAHVIQSFTAEEHLNWIQISIICGGRDSLGVSEDAVLHLRTNAVKEALQGQIVVATPGRMAELVMLERDEAVKCLKDVRFVVLDEADRFRRDEMSVQLSTLLSCLPKQRQTALFSATLRGLKADDWRSLGVQNPELISIKNAGINRDLPAGLHLLACLFPSRLAKMDYLFSELPKTPKAIIFVNTCQTVNFYHKLFPCLLPNLCFRRLHGQMKQSARERVLASFLEDKIGILFTTDVAARGLDIPNIEYIYVLDAPQRPGELLHRMGRTARACRSGTAQVLLLESEKELLTHFSERGVIFKSETPLNGAPTFWAGCRREMVTDRGFFLAGRRAMVSFLRSYREHELRNVFPFEALNLHDIAMSFGLPALPRVRETRACPVSIIDSDFLAEMRVAPFLDPREAAQAQRNQLQNAKLIEERAARRKLAEKQAKMRKNRSYGERKRAKVRVQAEECQEANYEEKLAKKMRRGLISKAEFERIIDRLNAKHERNTKFG